MTPKRLNDKKSKNNLAFSDKASGFYESKNLHGRNIAKTEESDGSFQELRDVFLRAQRVAIVVGATP
jgi:hypothetical protein